MLLHPLRSMELQHLAKPGSGSLPAIHPETIVLQKEVIPRKSEGAILACKPGIWTSEGFWGSGNVSPVPQLSCLTSGVHSTRLSPGFPPWRTRATLRLPVVL
jgi:hypothetical protein